MCLNVGRWWDDLRDGLKKDMEESCGQAVKRLYPDIFLGEKE
jgi:hypothetical protein